MASASLLLPLGCILSKSNSTFRQRVYKINNSISVQSLVSEHRLQALNAAERLDECSVINRRNLINLGFGLLSILSSSSISTAAGLPPEDKPKLCDDACEKELENVAANYVAMVPSGQIFDSSLERGLPYIFRVGAGQVIKGLDEGILSMKAGGKRRLYIPGPLAFPKGLTSAPGRPRVAPSSPVIFDVSLEYIPGLEEDEQ